MSRSSRPCPPARRSARRASTSARSRTAQARRRCRRGRRRSRARGRRSAGRRAQRIHNAIFAVAAPTVRAMRWLALVAALVLAPAAAAQFAPAQRAREHRDAPDPLPRARRRLAAGVAAPAGPDSRPGDPARHLAARPRGRRRPERAPLGRPAGRGRLRGHQPGRGGPSAALVLVGRSAARSPTWRACRRSRATHGVNVDPHRIYAFGGSMGGQETLLLVAMHPHLLAGAAAFDPATDMRGATATSPRSRTARVSSAWRARRWAGRRRRPACVCEPQPRPLRAAARVLGRPAADLLEPARPHDPRPVVGGRRARRATSAPNRRAPGSGTSRATGLTQPRWIRPSVAARACALRSAAVAGRAAGAHEIRRARSLRV